MTAEFYPRCYDGRMKTWLIVGRTPMPARLREVVERGSTAVVESRVDELGASEAGDADRVVVWAAPDEAGVGALAERFGRGGPPERADRFLLVSPEAAGAAAGVPAAQAFVWPRDAERLEMAFMTGA
jgi:hypothetical protein